jgi:hypothetical protein
MMQRRRMHFPFVSMGVEARCCPCHSAAHCRYMKRQPCLCHHHPRHGRRHCNRRRHLRHYCQLCHHCHCRCPSPSPLPITITVGHCCCGCRQPSPPLSLLRCRQPLPSPSPLPLPSPSAIAVSVTVGHHCCHLHWPSLSPLPLAISKSCCLGMARILFDRLMQRMLTLFYFVRTVGGALIKAG